MPFLDIFSSKKSAPALKRSLITIDFRERNSLVPSALQEKSCPIEFKQLPVADYLIENIAIERKTLSDLQSSIVNKRIVSQLIELKQYPKHLLIVEGFPSPDKKLQLHKNALRGLLLSIAFEHQVPIIFTHDEEDTASYLAVIATKKSKTEFSLRPSKTFRSKKEQLQYIIEGFPNIGPTKAKALIKTFGSLKNIFNASSSDLEKILGSRTKSFLDLIT
tara:strand:+ start:1360 stop:2016 length:657 start_codon:yes stop_codon:yes gene_type:complete